MSKAKKDPYRLPQAVVSMLDEHTSGYMLCALDHNGELTFIDKFDNHTVGSGIKFKLLQILTAEHQADVAALKAQILGVDPEEPEEE